MEILMEGRGNAPGDSDIWLLWHDALVSLASTSDAIDVLRPMLEGNTLDQPLAMEHREQARPIGRNGCGGPAGGRA